MPKIDVGKVMVRKGSMYPEPYRQKAKDRLKQALGDAGGLTQFGVNLVRLPPGEWSSQRHWHTAEDEFVWVLEGEVTLKSDAGETVLRVGECAAFPKGAQDAHCLVNKSGADVVYLEIGSRVPGDVTEYPDIDMRATDAGYFRKDGTRY